MKILGTVTTNYTFDTDEIKDFVNNPDLTDEQVQDIADVLACNVELPYENERGVIDIIPSNFNDSFTDMHEDFIATYS